MNTLEIALDLAANRGIPVFPCKPDKTPATPHGFKDATTDLAQIEAWFSNREALIGVPTGAASGLNVLDVDPKGYGWYAEHAQDLQCGCVNNTRRGYHLVYQASIPVQCSTSKIAPGVDVRGEGGYVIWWPAMGLPQTGSLDDLTQFPAWLLDRRAGQHADDGGPHENQHEAGAYVHQPDGKIGEGRRNDAMSRLAFRLRKAGLDVSEIEAALLTANANRCSPPLPEDEVRGIARRKAAIVPDFEFGTGGAEHHGDDPVLSRRPLAWGDLKTRTPEPRAWAVQDWLPMGTASLLAGRGGIGKTLLAQTIATCLVGHQDYFADTPRPLRVLMWAGEDDHDELWRRQIDICQWAGIPMEELDDKLVLQSYASQDITLAGMAFGQLSQTRVMTELREQVHDYRADYVFLDSVARTYGGNENDRHQVTTYISWITAACGTAGVCLLGHPGKAQGAEYSGSTAWEGSVRARLYLGERLPDAKPDDDDDAPEDNIRYLARRKANYSAKDWVKLEYRSGVLMPNRSTDYAPFGVPSDEYQKDTVMRAVRTLAGRGIHGNASTRSGDYLPKLAKQYKLLDRMTDKQFAAVMRQLILDGQLVTAEVGKYANRNPRMGLRVAA